MLQSLRAQPTRKHEVAHPSWFPCLTVLSKLKTVITEEDIDSSLSDFVKVVLVHLDGCIYHLRELAADALPALMPASAMHDIAYSLLLSLSPADSPNRLHGRLLAIHALLQEVKLQATQIGVGVCDLLRITNALRGHGWLASVRGQTEENAFGIATTHLVLGGDTCCTINPCDFVRAAYFSLVQLCVFEDAKPTATGSLQAINSISQADSAHDVLRHCVIAAFREDAQYAISLGREELDRAISACYMYSDFVPRLHSQDETSLGFLCEIFSGNNVDRIVSAVEVVRIHMYNISPCVTKVIMQQLWNKVVSPVTPITSSIWLACSSLLIDLVIAVGTASFVSFDCFASLQPQQELHVFIKKLVNHRNLRVCEKAVALLGVTILGAGTGPVIAGGNEDEIASWLSLLLSISKDETRYTLRQAALQSLHCASIAMAAAPASSSLCSSFSSTLIPKQHLITLYQLLIFYLQSEEDDLRDLAAATVSNVLHLSPHVSPRHALSLCMLQLESLAETHTAQAVNLLFTIVMGSGTVDNLSNLAVIRQIREKEDGYEIKQVMDEMCVYVSLRVLIKYFSLF